MTFKMLGYLKNKIFKMSSKINSKCLLVIWQDLEIQT